MSNAARDAVSGAHRRTLNTIFAHPIAHNLEWPDVVHLLENVGEVDQEAGAEIAVVIEGQRLTMRKPHHKDLTSPEVLEIRHLLSRAGFGPAPSEAAADPVPVPPGMLVAMDHHGARVFVLDESSADPTEHTMRPYDPHGFLHHLTHKDQSREHGQRAAEDPGYYERIAKTVAAGGHIVVVGHGKGHSNAAHHLVEYLQAHHREVYGRSVTEVTADLSSLTDKQLFALGREKLSQQPA